MPCEGSFPWLEAAQHGLRAWWGVIYFYLAQTLPHSSSIIAHNRK